MNQHTPTPWYKDLEAKTRYRIAGPQRGTGKPETVILVESWCNPENVDLILRAVNAHEELVAAVKKIADAPCPHPGFCEHVIARAALAQVEKGGRP